MIPAALSSALVEQAHQVARGVSRDLRSSYMTKATKDALTRFELMLDVVGLLDADVAHMKNCTKAVRRLVDDLERRDAMLSEFESSVEEWVSEDGVDRLVQQERDAEISRATEELEQILHAAPKPPRKEGDA